MHPIYPTDGLSFSRSAKVIAQASDILPGGVSSNFRLGMLPHPLVFERGEGPYLFEVDGNRLIDYYGGMGATLLGHNPAVVRQAVHEQAERGFLYAGQSPVEFEAAQLLHERVPSAQKLRFCSSGSEAAQSAIRLARAATGRNVIVKFEGHLSWLVRQSAVVHDAADRGGGSRQASGGRRR